jgi:hypothetical protein
MGENLCQLFPGQGINIRIVKELKKLNKKASNSINKWTNKLNFSKEEQLTN